MTCDHFTKKREMMRDHFTKKREMMRDHFTKKKGNDALSLH